MENTPDRMTQIEYRGTRSHIPVVSYLASLPDDFDPAGDEDWLASELEGAPDAVRGSDGRMYRHV
jgi:hypothetical protein